MTEYERFGLVFTKTRVYNFGHRASLKKSKIFSDLFPEVVYGNKGEESWGGKGKGVGAGFFLVHYQLPPNFWIHQSFLNTV
jgi:hypothetical protein